MAESPTFSHLSSYVYIPSFLQSSSPLISTLHPLPFKLLSLATYVHNSVQHTSLSEDDVYQLILDNWDFILEQALISLCVLLISVIALNLTSPSSSSTSNSTAADEYKAREAEFARLWPEISACEHARLVLPPDCRFVANYKPLKDETSAFNRLTRTTSTVVGKIKGSLKKGRPEDKRLETTEEEADESEDFKDAGSSSSPSHDRPSTPLTIPPRPATPPTPPSTPPQSQHFFDAAPTKSAMRKLSQPPPLPDGSGYIFDNIADTCTPLVCFVNSRSGGNQGKALITHLRRVLNPIQVWDLAHGPPEKVLTSFTKLPKARILVCGGDGTVSWILQALEALSDSKPPPIAILPLGTGNDLARIHGWGGGYTNENILSLLEEVSKSYVSLLDRWELRIEPKQKGSKRGKSRAKPAVTKTFNNYVGVGADAQAALDFHSLRENKPELFFSRLVNKVWYAVLGAEDIFRNSCADIPEVVSLVADGVEVKIPEDSQGIIFLNIDSFAGGIKMWGTGKTQAEIDGEAQMDEEMKNGGGNVGSNTGSRPQNRRRLSSIDSATGDEDEVMEMKPDFVGRCKYQSSCQDGMIDIVSIRGSLHIGQINIGISSATKLGQCREAVVTTRRKLPVQLDGEPWGQGVAVMKISRKKEQAVMLHKAEADVGGDVATEMTSVLDWAEERKIIDGGQHAALMKEFSRRIEGMRMKKRKGGSRDNLVSLGQGVVTRTLRKGMSMAKAGASGGMARSESTEHFLNYELGLEGGRETPGDRRQRRNQSEAGRRERDVFEAGAGTSEQFATDCSIS